MSSPPGEDGRTTKPRLVYRIDGNAAGWTVRCETEAYGPYVTLHAAMLRAVDEAQAANRAGFDGAVVTPSPSPGLCAGTNALSPGAGIAEDMPAMPAGRAGRRAE